MKEKLNLRNLRGDIFGGITTAIVALPLAIAFGLASMNGDPEGAVAGLYSAIFTGIFSTLFGGTPAGINGPTGAMIVVLSSAYGTYGRETFFAAMVLTGILQLVYGYLKIGRYTRFIPRPVIIGFTNGIGILIFLKQLNDFNNAPIVAMLVIGIMFGFPYLTKRIPASMIALIIGSVVGLFYFPEIAVVGEINSGLPHFHLPLIGEINWIAAFSAAITMSLLGSLESLLASLVVEDMTEDKSDMNQELKGQGIGNLISPLFGGLIGTGAIIRSAVNVNNGGRTKLSGILHGLIMLIITLSFGWLTAYIPKAVLAGVLMVTAVKMIEFESVKIIRRLPKADSTVMIITTLLTVFMDLTEAVLAGVMLSFFLFAIKMAQFYFEGKEISNLEVWHLSGPIFFGTTDKVLDFFKGNHLIGDKIVLDFTNVPVIDETGAETLRKAFRKICNDDRQIYLFGLNSKESLLLENLDIINSSENIRAFKTFSDVHQYIFSA
ncbi:MAG: SulP family inorganic anion transporter [Halanaerobiales bacterium]|nr:SulP family inorganic anion transporter [Halanaerobiales bacterium]